MRKLIILTAVALFLLGGGPVFAEPVSVLYDGVPVDLSERGITATVHDPIDTSNFKQHDDYVLGAKADAPNLVRLSENWTIGVEGGKDLNQTNSDQGWFAFAKVTFTGSILDFSK